MTLRDLFADTFRTLWSHKVRTALTMFGIGWGVVSITLMVAAGEGLRVGQQKQTDNLGKDLMIIFAGRTSLQVGGARAGRPLNWNDTDPDNVLAQVRDPSQHRPHFIGERGSLIGIGGLLGNDDLGLDAGERSKSLTDAVREVRVDVDRLLGQIRQVPHVAELGLADDPLDRLGRDAGTEVAADLLSLGDGAPPEDVVG